MHKHIIFWSFDKIVKSTNTLNNNKFQKKKKRKSIPKAQIDVGNDDSKARRTLERKSRRKEKMKELNSTYYFYLLL